MDWKEWLQRNADRLILMVLYMGSLSFVLHLVHSPNVSAENISWAREAAGTILGAILGLITGASLAGRKPPDNPQS
jgi:hypothetical protein